MKSNKLICYFSMSMLAFTAFFISCKTEEPAKMPIVSTEISVSNITASSAKSGGTITDDKGETVTARGVCWSIATNPTTKDSLTKDASGAGLFVSQMRNLIPNTSYYVRAYASNRFGTSYGNAINFKTLVDSVKLTTTPISAITTSTATGGGEVTNDGNGVISERGICWNTATNPTITNPKTSDGSGKGSFVSNLTNLVPGTKYYVRAYAKNDIGTSYGTVETFTTTADFPTVITTTPTAITSASVTVGGNANNDGGAEITAKGICWSTSSNPTISNSKTINGTGKGEFTTTLTGLTPSTTYYIRAYATNIIGTAYGSMESITTLTIPTTVTDIDGNVYNIVTIGTQTWMAENLKTTHYRDGSAIPNVTSTTSWASLTTGAWCDYNNTSTNGTIYGHLYNWYAVENIKNIAPVGWHVPTDSEWAILTNYLIANSYNYDGTNTGNKIGKSIASKSNWNVSTNIGAIGNNPSNNNSSGFSALPSGHRESGGTYLEIGNHGEWWCKNAINTNAYFILIRNYESGSTQSQRFKVDGVPVRCVKD